MPMKRKSKGDAFEAMHSSASALHRAGAMGEATMRDFARSLVMIPAIKPGTN
ncbi:MAG: hypothetical protein JWO52_2056 [Gammaproteobacteria bacterium]|nr:hypothetical protein [Gammaproteobacteria bacterium]